MITSSTNLSEEEIRRAREDAKKYEDDVAGQGVQRHYERGRVVCIYVENLLETRGRTARQEGDETDQERLRVSEEACDTN